MALRLRGCLGSCLEGGGRVFAFNGFSARYGKGGIRGCLMVLGSVLFEGVELGFYGGTFGTVLWMVCVLREVVGRRGLMFGMSWDEKVLVVGFSSWGVG